MKHRTASSLDHCPTLKIKSIALLDELDRARKKLTAKQANAYLTEVREDRKRWRGR